MVVIDQVYQKVLALANKEQRGYITPQEFNLLADKAQNEIFDRYFHSMKISEMKPKNQMGVAFDEVEMLQEKLHPFKTSQDFTQTLQSGIFSNSISLPSDLYFINSIRRTEGEVVELSEKEIMYTEENPLTRATINKSVYVRRASGTIQLYPIPLEITTYTLDYYRKPITPKWNYVVVNKKALYNSANSTNFEVHVSEEEFLVSRILELAGIVKMKPGIVEIGKSDKVNIKAEQNS